MVTAKTKRVGFAALAMATVLMVASPTLAASSLTIQNVSSSGSTAVVTVRNSSLLLSYGTVRVEANINGSTSSASTSVLLLPGQTANVSVKFCGTISALLSVGLTDAPNPF